MHFHPTPAPPLIEGREKNALCGGWHGVKGKDSRANNLWSQNGQGMVCRIPPLGKGRARVGFPLVAQLNFAPPRYAQRPKVKRSFKDSGIAKCNLATRAEKDAHAAGKI